MRFLSLCSGIEAASVAWAPMGWKAAAVAEIEAFPSAVLAHHYPDVPNLGDITKFKEWPDLGTVDIVCGGTPCQSFSVAGLRKGLADPRGNLSLTFLAIVDRYRPRYVVWENVPGVLSSDGGRDFAAFLGGLGQLGYGWAFRVLDAQHVRVDGFPRAVPQRRRRVFVVGYLGDWRRAAAVLSEPESVLGNSPPRREARQGVARPIAGCAPGGSGYRNDADTADNLIAGTLGLRSADHPSGLKSESEFIVPVAPTLRAGGNQTGGDRPYGTDVDTCDSLIATRPVAATLTRGAESAGKGGYAGRRQEDDENLVAHSVAPAITSNPYGDHESREGLLVAHSLRAEGFDASEDGTGRGTPIVPVSFGGQMSTPMWDFDLSQTLQAKNPQAVATGWAVRRLMPVECERLQGFPDGWTDIPYRGKRAADGPRYKALGNSMACNVIRWVGRRIEMVEQIAADLQKERAA